MQGFKAATALITPFTQKGSVEASALAGLIERQIEAGTEALVLCGSTGEGVALSRKEKLEIFAQAKEVAGGRISLIGGIGTNVTRDSYEMAKRAKEMGLEAGLVIVPYYNRPEPRGVIRHFEEIAKAGLPLIAYYHPKRTGCHLPFEALQRICQIDGVVGLKEASGDLSLFEKMCQSGDVPVYSGDDMLVHDQLDCGGKGSISVVGNVLPEEWKRALGDRSLYQKLQPFCMALGLETNPQPVKHALFLLGLCDNVFRLPLVPPTQKVSETLARLLNELGYETRPASLV